MLLQNRLAAKELDALLPALGTGFLLGLGALVAQKLGVFRVSQMRNHVAATRNDGTRQGHTDIVGNRGT